MTERQLIAYSDPSARALGSGKKKFCRFVRVGPILYSTILTVNK